jgi:putative transcriptional regulator
MVDRKVPLTELAQRVGITNANLSILKNNKVKAIRLATLNALCRELSCQPGDLLEYVDDEA